MEHSNRSTTLPPPYNPPRVATERVVRFWASRITNLKSSSNQRGWVVWLGGLAGRNGALYHAVLEAVLLRGKIIRRIVCTPVVYRD